MADGKSVPVPLAVKTSDLKVRTLSAVVMLLVAGGALWLGGWFWLLFIGILAVGLFWEWVQLVRTFSRSSASLLVWLLGGVIYIGTAIVTLALLRGIDGGVFAILLCALGVIATDVGAYFAGRTIGGPKIAPRISPSKTWAGLLGGMVAAAAMLIGMIALTANHYGYGGDLPPTLGMWGLLGASLAICAQVGDFFESWMKRRAAVKDSGRLIPGHGGLFDRLDGLLAVLFAFMVTLAIGQLT